SFERRASILILLARKCEVLRLGFRAKDLKPVLSSLNFTAICLEFPAQSMEFHALSRKDEASHAAFQTGRAMNARLPPGLSGRRCGWSARLACETLRHLVKQIIQCCALPVRACVVIDYQSRHISLAPGGQIRIFDQFLQ